MSDPTPAPAVLAAFCAASPVPFGGTIGAAARTTGAVRSIAVILDRGKATGYVYQTFGSETYLLELHEDAHDSAKRDLPERIGSPADALPKDTTAKAYACPAPLPRARQTP